MQASAPQVLTVNITSWELKCNASFKLLTQCEGTQYSGKTTIRNQLSFLDGYELLDEEREKYGRIILQNILEAFASLQEGKRSIHYSINISLHLYSSLNSDVLTPQEKAVHTQPLCKDDSLKLTRRLPLSICVLSSFSQTLPSPSVLWT